jgi:anhydro-N-acetylmuramic acid kinase
VEPWERLDRARARPERRILGLMSGMSRDGLDLALVRIAAGPPRRLVLEAAATRPYDAALRERLLRAPEADAAALARLDFDLGEAWSREALAFLASAGVEPAAVDAIGSHGQTVAHHPREEGRGAATLQIGQADVLAERTGIPVVSDFRPRDIAAGGEGAPLVPLAEWWLHAEPGRVTASLNLGSIANLTVVPAALEAVVAFDAGPANALVDAFARRLGAACDEDGRLSAGGRVDEGLLLELYIRRRRWLAQAPPRSAGYGTFGAALADEAAAAHPRIAGADLVRTAIEFTALTVRDAFERFVVGAHPGLATVRVSGGGARNPTLLAALRERLGPLGLALETLDPALADAKEAVAFALLADATLAGRPGNCPGATGARRAVVLELPNRWVVVTPESPARFLEVLASLHPEADVAPGDG